MEDTENETPEDSEDKKERGRPTDYKPEFVEQARKLCQLGAVDMEIADFFDVNVATIYRWKLDHDDFCEAMKVGKEIADTRVERSLYQKAVGYDYKEEQAHKIKEEQYKESIEIVEVTKHNPADTTAIKFWLINRRKEDYRERTEIDHTSKGKEIFTFNVRELDGTATEEN